MKVATANNPNIFGEYMGVILACSPFGSIFLTCKVHSIKNDRQFRGWQARYTQHEKKSYSLLMKYQQLELKKSLVTIMSKNLRQMLEKILTTDLIMVFMKQVLQLGMVTHLQKKTQLYSYPVELLTFLDLGQNVYLQHTRMQTNQEHLLERTISMLLLMLEIMSL